MLRSVIVIHPGLLRRYRPRTSSGTERSTIVPIIDNSSRCCGPQALGMLRHIGTDVTMLHLWSRERIEDFTMDPVLPRILSSIIIRYPLLKLTEHGVLSLQGRIFVWLPWPPEIVGKTLIDPRISFRSQSCRRQEPSCGLTRRSLA